MNYAIALGSKRRKEGEGRKGNSKEWNGLIIRWNYEQNIIGSVVSLTWN